MRETGDSEAPRARPQVLNVQPLDDTLESERRGVKPRPLAEPLLSPGDELGGCYEVRGLLGTGGMGQVFEAHDRMLNRDVAIKVCRPDIDGEVLLREGRVMAAFHHASLPTVYAMGRHGGMSYLVMERLRGRSLAKHLRGEGGFSIDNTRRIVLSVAEGLQLLHDATLVHRDLKPDNVMLIPPDRTVLFDFGVSDVTRFVATDGIAGSPKYIAPEVLAGQVLPEQAPLVDVYSLGVIGYQMLTGRTPFVGGHDLTEIAAFQRDRQPPAIAELRPDAAGPLAALLMQMIAREPGDRPHGIDEVVIRLRALERAGRGDVALGPVRILVADDEPVIWELLSYVLEDEGYELMCVENGARALEAFERRRFDIVLADKNMPELSGLELLREVKSRSPDTDVVLITGYSSKEAAIDAINSGASRFVEKPFDVDELAAMVAELAAKRRAPRPS